jgi:hypothetical protein
MSSCIESLGSTVVRIRGRWRRGPADPTSAGSPERLSPSGTHLIVSAEDGTWRRTEEGQLTRS